MYARHPIRVLGLAALVCSASLFAGNTPMTELMTLPRTDFVNVGVGGIGAAAIDGGGVGTLELSGVSGTVTQALLYWEGIDIAWAPYHYTGGNYDYDEAAIVFDGMPLNGTRLSGQGANNGWPSVGLGDPPPPASAALYRADVTSLVQAGGNRSYVVSGLADGAGHSANGASLIVYFDDGNPVNDQHVAHYEGMQSNDGALWQMGLSIEYAGGAVEAIFHVADGQSSLTDGSLQFRVTPGVPGVVSPPYASVEFSATHFDGQPLWAGMSVPVMGFGRSPDGPRLWDIRRFPLGGAFGFPRSYSVLIERQGGNEAISLLVAQIVQPADAQPQNLMLTPTPLDFGDVVRDTVSPVQTFTLRNLLPHPIAIAGTPVANSAYQIVAQSCSGQVLAAGASCSVDVACAPTFLGPAPVSSLQVRWTPPGSSVQRTAYAPLSCYGVRAELFSRLSISPDSCDFGQLPTGATSVPHVFTAHNTGTLALAVTTVQTGSASRFLVSSDGCSGASLQPGESCPVALVFNPTSGGSFARNLTISYSASDITGSALSSLSGSGTSPTSNAVFRYGFELAGCQ